MSSAFWRFNQQRISKRMILPHIKNKIEAINELSENIVNKSAKSSLRNKFKFGKSWNSPALRLKSDYDLKVLWYVLLKERLRLKSEEYNAVRKHMLGGRRVTSCKERVEKSMSRLKSVIDERINLKNSVMQLLEYYEFKKQKYKNRFDAKNPKSSKVKEPMFTKNELDELSSLEISTQEFQLVNPKELILKEYNDLNDLNDSVPYYFDVNDPLNLSQFIINKDNFTQYNKILIIKRHFFNILKIKKSLEELGVENLNTPNEELKLRLGKILRNNIYRFKLYSSMNYFLDHKGRLVDLSPEVKEELFDPINDDILKNKKVCHRIRQSVYEQIKIHIDFIKELENSVFDEKEILKLLHKNSTKYLNNIEKNINNNFQKLKQSKLNYLKESVNSKLAFNLVNQFKKVNENSINYVCNSRNKPSKMDEYLSLVRFALDKNYNKILEKVLIEKELCKLLVGDMDTLVDTNIINFKNTFFIDFGLNRILREQIFNKKVDEENSEEVQRDKEKEKEKISVLSESEIEMVKHLSTKKNMKEIIPLYIKNYTELDAHTENKIFYHIQKGRSKMARDIALKELSAISYQANKINEDLENGDNKVESGENKEEEGNMIKRIIQEKYNKEGLNLTSEAEEQQKMEIAKLSYNTRKARKTNNLLYKKNIQFLEKNKHTLETSNPAEKKGKKKKN